jgi:cell division protein FtsA
LYATAVGLVMNSIENRTQSAVKADAIEFQNSIAKPPAFQNSIVEESINEIEKETVLQKESSTETKIRSSFFGGYLDKIKDFLDNAE